MHDSTWPDNSDYLHPIFKAARAGPPDTSETFYTTKATGPGMGLSICRSVIEAHGGRLWASPNQPPGAVVQFTVPAQPLGRQPE